MAPSSNNRRKRTVSGTHEVPKFNSTSQQKRIDLNDYEEVEDEYGFKYMRKKQKMILSEMKQKQEDYDDDEVLSTPVPKMVTLTATKKSAISATVRANDAFSPSTPTPSKQILENNRKKRRSSFAVVAAATQNSVRNSLGAAAPALQSQLPPSNVKTTEYHRHLQPDLPGPVKMRQLMIWACQKAAVNVPSDKIISSKLVDSLISNELSTSWYQRPNNVNPAEGGNVYYLPNPQNQELLECIQLYKNYHLKLQNECEIWEEFKKNPHSFKPKSIKISSDLKIDNTLNVLFADEFQTLNKWLNSLPLSIDRLDWNTKLALSFQDHAKQFCEGVFHQIFAKFFSRASKAQRIEPMMILRALSTNTFSN